MTFLGIEINEPFDGVYTRSNVSCSITQYISGKRLNGRQDFLLGIDNRGLSRRGQALQSAQHPTRHQKQQLRYPGFYMIICNK